ncbi:hypothetical protein VNO78_06421 [Psophocarpus tetragonolobus]|uniref:Uncharacterized protein n=1 Tax=Psophocarpus tetragonolobus TaxID=3891 RepID=A0AAN9T225_PSOTE
MVMTGLETSTSCLKNLAEGPETLEFRPSVLGTTCNLEHVFEPCQTWNVDYGVVKYQGVLYRIKTSIPIAPCAKVWGRVIVRTTQPYLCICKEAVCRFKSLTNKSPSYDRLAFHCISSKISGIYYMTTRGVIGDRWSMRILWACAIGSAISLYMVAVERQAQNRERMLAEQLRAMESGESNSGD